MSIYATIFLIAIITFPIFISLFISIFLFRRNRRGRRSPLTGNLLRGAGESLRTEIEKISERINETFYNMLTLFVPPLVIVLFLASLGNGKVPYWQLILTFIFYCLLIFWANRRLYAMLRQRRNLYLGLDAELAVGQELNQLMHLGCRVYHDFPAENFNIDHVVVGPGGVFAIETKGRAKPDKGRGSVDATVIYDGQILRFPDLKEREPLEQSKRQAEWLQKWLCSAVGETVTVRPALALPGWFIERTKPGNVLIFNGKSPQFLAKPQGIAGMTTLEMVQRIAHQLEQRCRDVEPVAYRKTK